LREKALTEPKNASNKTLNGQVAVPTYHTAETKTVACNIAGVVSAQSVAESRMGIDAIVSGTKVQQAKSQIPKQNGSK
jgi:hypothetical protein